MTNCRHLIASSQLKGINTFRKLNNNHSFQFGSFSSVNSSSDPSSKQIPFITKVEETNFHFKKFGSIYAIGMATVLGTAGNLYLLFYFNATFI